MEHFLTEHHNFVVFTMDSTANRWWQKYLKTPFWHVMVIRAWVLNNKHYIQIEDSYFRDWSLKKKTSEIFEVTHWYSYMRSYRHFCIQNNNTAPKVVKIKIFLDKYNFLHKTLIKLPLCTMHVSRMFGIASYAITPFQLYRVLKRKGCSNLF
jgi:hypothetical protein